MAVKVGVNVTGEMESTVPAVPVPKTATCDGEEVKAMPREVWGLSGCDWNRC